MKAEDAHDLGLLLRFALTPRRRPSVDPQYHQLVQRMQRDGTFADAFGRLAEGAGLIVLSVDDFGVSLGCTDDSPFAMRLADFRSGMSAADRAVYGLVFLAIAAWCYPKGSDLDEVSAGVRRLDVVELTDFLVELCERLRDEHTEDAEVPSGQDGQDPEDGDEEFRAAWRLVLEGAASKPSASGRRGSTTLSGKVKHTLEKLHDAGLVVRDGDPASERYRSTRALRTQLRELAAHRGFQLVRDASARSSVGSASVGGEAPA